MTGGKTHREMVREGLDRYFQEQKETVDEAEAGV